MVGQLNAQYLMYNKDSVMTPSNNLSSNNIDYVKYIIRFYIL